MVLVPVMVVIVKKLVVVVEVLVVVVGYIALTVVMSVWLIVQLAMVAQPISSKSDEDFRYWSVLVGRRLSNGRKERKQNIALRQRLSNQAIIYRVKISCSACCNTMTTSPGSTPGA